MASNQHITSLKKAIDRSIRHLHRDYRELSISSAGNESKKYDYAYNSCMNFYRKFIESVREEYFVIVTDSKEINLDYYNSSDASEILICSIADGMSNFVQGLPFLGFAFSVLEREIEYKASSGIIELPILNQSIYAIKDHGAFIQNKLDNTLIKARVSKKNKDLFVGSTVMNFENARKYSDKVRVFGCNHYMAMLVSSGLIDLAIIDYDPLCFDVIRLIVEEAEGKCVVKGKSLYIYNGFIDI